MERPSDTSLLENFIETNFNPESLDVPEFPNNVEEFLKLTESRSGTDFIVMTEEEMLAILAGYKRGNEDAEPMSDAHYTSEIHALLALMANYSFYGAIFNLARAGLLDLYFHPYYGTLAYRLRDNVTEAQVNEVLDVYKRGSHGQNPDS